MSSKKLYSFITNLSKPVCISCTHFIEYKNNYTYESYTKKLESDKLGKCARFGVKHLVTGQIENDFAIHCREKHHCLTIFGKLG